jgi:uncharacterized protein with ParB-like and HNH nuclease domain
MAEGGGITGLMALFSDTDSLEVPDFQRNYSWGEEQIDEFHKDVVFATRKNLDHFMGSVILMKSPSEENSKTFQVIDGQQRLTTIFTYLSVVRDKAKSLSIQEISAQGNLGTSINVPSKANYLIFSNEELGIARFKSNSMLRTFIYEHIFREISPSRPVMPKTHKYFSLDLRKAYARINELLDKELLKCQSDDEKLRFLWELIKTFQNRIQVLRITTSSYPESFDIFMTLNSRGLALGPSDLVKSLFMKYNAEGLKQSQIIEENNEISNSWKDITDNIGDGDVDQFLRHYLVAKQDESIQAKRIYRKIESLVTSDPTKARAKSRELLNEISRKSLIYSQLLRPETIEDSFISENCKMLHPLLDTYRILMLTILDETTDLTLIQRRDLANICEILCVRWVLTGGNAQELEDHFQLVSLEIVDPEKSYESAKNLLISKIPADSKIATQFGLDTTKTALVRSVLYRINKVIGDSSEMIILDPKKMHVEHIAPASMTDHWREQLFPGSTDDVTAEYSVRVEQWGNKTLLDKKINESVGTKPFKEKCDGLDTGNWGGYRDTPLAITRELLHQNTWNYEVIKKRNKWIRDCFLSIWSLESKIQTVVPFHEWDELDAE